MARIDLVDGQLQGIVIESAQFFPGIQAAVAVRQYVFGAIRSSAPCKGSDFRARGCAAGLGAFTARNRNCTPVCLRDTLLTYTAGLVISLILLAVFGIIDFIAVFIDGPAILIVFLTGIVILTGVIFLIIVIVFLRSLLLRFL